MENLRQRMWHITTHVLLVMSIWTLLGTSLPRPAAGQQSSKTGSGSRQLRNLETQVLAEINRLRADPDDYAKRIVNMAAPYDVFPEDLSVDFDELTIVRTWKFLPGNRVKTYAK